MPVNAILFDLDGTLIDSAADIAAAANAARVGLGYAPLPVEEVRGAIGDGVDVLMARLVRPEDVARGVEIYREHYARHLLDATRPYPGIERLLADLRRARRLAVVSNKPLRYSRTILEGLGLARAFGAVVGGDGPSGRKPAAGPFAEALLALAARPEDALVVGDGRNDVLGARAAGIAVCGVLYGIGAPDEMRALAPDLLAASVEELRGILLGDSGRTSPSAIDGGGGAR